MQSLQRKAKQGSTHHLSHGAPSTALWGHTHGEAWGLGISGGPGDWVWAVTLSISGHPHSMPIQQLRARLTLDSRRPHTRLTRIDDDRAPHHILQRLPADAVPLPRPRCSVLLRVQGLGGAWNTWRARCSAV